MKVAIVEKGSFTLSNEISIAYIQAKGFNDIRVSPSESRGCSDDIEFLKDGVWELFFQFNGEPFCGADSEIDFRTDPQLIQLIEEFQSNGINPCEYKEDKIKIVEIPDDVEFGIDEFEMSGCEYIFECHRIWY